MLAFAAVFAALPLVAQATLSVLQPTSAGWVGNTTVTVSWSWDATDAPFTIELYNPTIQSGLLSQGPIAVANNIAPNTNSKTFDLPVLPPGNNYQIRLVGVSDINNVYASSPSFPLSPNPTSSSVTGSNTAVLTNNSQSISATTTKSGSSTKTASGSGTVTVTATGSSASSASGSSGSASASVPGSSTLVTRTTLAVTSVLPSSTSGASASPSSSSPSGAAARLGGSFTSAAFAIGAVIVGAFVVV